MGAGVEVVGALDALWDQTGSGGGTVAESDCGLAYGGTGLWAGVESAAGDVKAGTVAG